MVSLDPSPLSTPVLVAQSLPFPLCSFCDTNLDVELRHKSFETQSRLGNDKVEAEPFDSGGL